jgi:hypothetical protein
VHKNGKEGNYRKYGRSNITDERIFFELMGIKPKKKDKN